MSKRVFSLACGEKSDKAYQTVHSDYVESTTYEACYQPLPVAPMYQHRDIGRPRAAYSKPPDERRPLKAWG